MVLTKKNSADTVLTLCADTINRLFVTGREDLERNGADALTPLDLSSYTYGGGSVVVVAQYVCGNSPEGGSTEVRVSERIESAF